MNTITIDGSQGEGGGQIVRTAVALSLVTGKKLVINNIRANRPDPGLKAQHLKAIETAAKISSGEAEGLKLGSRNMVFGPGEIQGGTYDIDIGTAGSIPLLLQCIMIAAVKTQNTLTLKITGGTDVAWSPPIDYLRYVTLPALRAMGYKCELELLARGYYPRGGGSVKIEIKSSKLKGLAFEKNVCSLVEGISHSSRLPEHVAARQAASAEKTLNEVGYKAAIKTESKNYSSTGSGITLWCGTMGGSALGKRGLPAEKVGRDAADALLTELRTQAGLDIYLADQLIPYLGLIRGGSLTTRKLSLHAKTNIWVTEQFLGCRFKIEEKDGLCRVSIS